MPACLPACLPGTPAPTSPSLCPPPPSAAGVAAPRCLSAPRRPFTSILSPSSQTARQEGGAWRAALVRVWACGWGVVCRGQACWLARGSVAARAPHPTPPLSRMAQGRQIDPKTFPEAILNGSRLDLHNLYRQAPTHSRGGGVWVGGGAARDGVGGEGTPSRSVDAFRSPAPHAAPPHPTPSQGGVQPRRVQGGQRHQLEGTGEGSGRGGGSAASRLLHPPTRPPTHPPRSSPACATTPPTTR